MIVSAAFILSEGKFEINTGFVVYSAVAAMSLWTSKEVMQIDRTERIKQLTDDFILRFLGPRCKNCFSSSYNVPKFHF